MISYVLPPVTWLADTQKEEGEGRAGRRVRQKRKVSEMVRDADSRGKFSMGKLVLYCS